MPQEDAAHYRAQAIKCRRLARRADPREATILNDMADEYDAKAKTMDR